MAIGNIGVDVGGATAELDFEGRAAGVVAHTGEIGGANGDIRIGAALAKDDEVSDHSLIPGEFL